MLPRYAADVQPRSGRRAVERSREDLALFQVIDLYTESIEESDYVDFAAEMVSGCTLKPKGGCRRFRHAWPRKSQKHGDFLCHAITALRLAALGGSGGGPVDTAAAHALFNK